MSEATFRMDDADVPITRWSRPEPFIAAAFRWYALEGEPDLSVYL